jgi:DNA end-binding protein Ku
LIFDPSEFVDHYEPVVEMLRKKQTGIPATREQPSAPPQNVVNLMDALRRSLDEEKRSAPAKKGRKRLEGQREMLLPIPGKRGQGVGDQPVARLAARQKKAG